MPEPVAKKIVTTPEAGPHPKEGPASGVVAAFEIEFLPTQFPDEPLFKIA
jgi:hypothetical protein